MDQLPNGVKRNQFMIIVQEDQTANLLLFILKILVWELMLIGTILLIQGDTFKMGRTETHILKGV